VSKQFRRERSIWNAQKAGWICATPSSESTALRQSRIGNSVRHGQDRRDNRLIAHIIYLVEHELVKHDRRIRGGGRDLL
jgi:hypothetical protein